MNQRKTGFIHPIASPDGLWKAEEELNNIWTEEHEIARFLVLTPINVHCDANERAQKATNTSFDSNGFRKEKKKTKTKQLNKPNGREGES